MGTQIVIGIVIVLYLAMMILIGVVFSKGNDDAGDFYLGGRRLGPFVAAMSAEASDMSSWLLLGIPGLAYLSGMADATWTIIGLAIGTYLNWLFVAKRLRKSTEKLGAITIPEYFAARYKDEKKIITLISAVIIVIFFIPYVASGFAACGKLFNTLFGVDYLFAMIVSAIIIALYCSLGGFKAVCMTDLVQSIAMTLSLIIVIFFGITQAGGWDAVVENAKSLPGYFSITQIHDPVSKSASPYGVLTACSMLAWGLGYFGMPHILVRFMAIENEDKIKISRRVASVWVVIAMFVALLIGVIGLAMSSNGAIPVLEGSGNAERVIIYITNLMSTYGILPAIVAGIILSGILAATMSTADSQLLASASAISSDLIQAFGKKKLDDENQVKVAKVTVIIISIVAIFIARDPNSSVFQIVSFAWAGFGAAFGPVVLLSLFWKRSNLYGALAGMISGGAFVFIWKYGIAKLGGGFAIYELLPAFLIALIVNVVVSLATKTSDT
ncbi:sodium/proline symporter [Butyrivibrio sp. VCB2006]|uniref:sodium/proline symporter n=1 Tax=Butyrivibrio sp. VCB2006 TaxID=1280679 RepID=UPI0004126730|nr:sodium/proline symporter [Butyrivibrio sp. VCB2006]